MYFSKILVYMSISYTLSLSTVLLLAAAVSASYSGGAGTVDCPYQIRTQYDWQQLMASPADWDKHFILLEHINLTNIECIAVGRFDKRFSGVFDGNGFTIRNLWIETPKQQHTGLFGYIAATGRIKNLGVVNAYVRGSGSVGMVAGLNHGIVKACYAQGTVRGSEWDIGGLVGTNIGGSIAYCHANVEVISENE